MEQEDIHSILSQSQEAFGIWKKLDFRERAHYMRAVSRILLEKKTHLSMKMAEEMGKPIHDGLSEVEKCAWVCEYYAENTQTFLQDETIKTDALKSFVTFQPLGIVLAIMPWNFPFWQVFRFAAPSLMAGNVAVLKHSSIVPGCALSIEDVFRSAGLPENVFRTLVTRSKDIWPVIEDSRVAAVTFTGSKPAGREVGSRASKNIKKSALELGGSDPYLILADAELENTVESCVTNRLINKGQSCIAAKRFVVVEAIRKEFETRFVKKMRAYQPGDPTRKDTRLGPLATHDLRDELHRQVQESVRKGAQCLLGGEIPAGPGAFYQPTVLTDVGKGMPAYEEELFGPVAAVIPVKTEQDAIGVANDNSFGLGAAVYTQDRKRGERIAAHELEAGCCFVNSFVRSDPRLPFGGVKESGYGRELSSYGIREFVNINTVYVG